MEHSNNPKPESHFCNIDGHRIHYLDEGHGETILLVHGIPEWSMLYAGLVKQLSRTHRCIVPDHLGFGLSDLDNKADLTPAAHASRLVNFIEQLKLSDIHLVVHDYGGPIGIGALVAQPKLFKSLTITNTWLWNLAGTNAAKGLALMNGWFGKWLYLSYGFSVKFMAKNAFAQKSCYRKNRETFMQAHHTEAQRFANYKLMLEMLGSSSYFDESLKRLHQTPIKAQIIWGVKDKFFPAKEYLARWKMSFPTLKSVNWRIVAIFRIWNYQQTIVIRLNSLSGICKPDNSTLLACFLSTFKS